MPKVRASRRRQAEDQAPHSLKPPTLLHLPPLAWFALATVCVLGAQADFTDLRILPVRVVALLSIGMAAMAERSNKWHRTLADSRRVVFDQMDRQMATLLENSVGLTQVGWITPDRKAILITETVSTEGSVRTHTVPPEGSEPMYTLPPAGAPAWQEGPSSANWQIVPRNP